MILRNILYDNAKIRNYEFKKDNQPSFFWVIFNKNLLMAG